KSKPERLVEKLGERYEIVQTDIKKWTVGSPIQGPLDAVEAIRSKRPFEADQVQRVTVRLAPSVAAVVDNRDIPDICLQHMVVDIELADRSQLAHMAKETKATLDVEKLDAVADRGYFNSEEILECENAGISVTLPKPMTSNSKAEGRFGKQDFRYVAKEDVYICPAGEKLAYSFTTQDKGMVLRRYRTAACQSC